MARIIFSSSFCGNRSSSSCGKRLNARYGFYSNRCGCGSDCSTSYSGSGWTQSGDCCCSCAGFHRCSDGWTNHCGSARNWTATRRRDDLPFVPLSATSYGSTSFRGLIRSSCLRRSPCSPLPMPAAPLHHEKRLASRTPPRYAPPVASACSCKRTYHLVAFRGLLLE
jgi:hypothetical protein